MTPVFPTPLTDPRRKRLHYQCWHRGMREMDMILGHFADRHLAGLDEDDLKDLETLLAAPDQALYRWVCRQEEVPDLYRSRVFDLVSDVRDLPSLWNDRAGRGP